MRTLTTFVCLVSLAMFGVGCSDSNTAEFDFSDGSGLDPDAAGGGDLDLDVDESEDGPDTDDTGGGVDDPDGAGGAGDDADAADEADTDDTSATGDTNGGVPDVDDTSGGDEGDTETGDQVDVDDTGGGEPDVDDTGDDPDVDDTSDDPDVGPPDDPCDGVMCDAPPAATCEGGAAVTFGEGTCVADGADYSCDYVVTTTTCSDTQFCLEGACTPFDPELPPDFAPTASYVTELHLLGAAPGCFDYTGDGQPDSGLGDLVTSLLGVVQDDVPDIDETLADAIEGGGISLVFEIVDLQDLAGDDDLSLRAFSSYSEDDFATRSEGQSHFLIEPKSFWPETWNPMNHLDEGDVEAGGLKVSDGAFAFWLPFAAGFPVIIQQGRMTAAASVGTNGTGLTLADGKLGGVIPLDNLVEIVNVVTDCECFGLPEGATPFETNGESKIACTDAMASADVSTCAAEGGVCASIGGMKTLLCAAVGIISPDVDTDDNNKADAFSICMSYEGVSATIDGVGTDQPVWSPGCSGSGHEPSVPLTMLLGAVALWLVWRRERHEVAPRG